MQFREAMDDDFNTARAIALMFDLSRRCKDQSLNRTEQEAAAALLLKLGKVLGFFELEPARKEAEMPDISKKLIELIIDYRKEARAAKQWAVSDKIRDDLMSLGIEIKDGPEGSTWTLRKQ